MIFFEQGLIENFPAGFDFGISNAIGIAIGKLIRIDQTLIEHGLHESGFTGRGAPDVDRRPYACTNIIGNGRDT